jgi:two-component sensor histidine kinase
LHASEGIDEIEVAAYLATLCASLGTSMIGDARRIAIKVISDTGMITSARAVSSGPVVTELLINSIKYAFPFSRTDALIQVRYEIGDPDWTLTVSDNGIGRLLDEAIKPTDGLGTAIVKALVRQLDAQVETISTPQGTTILIAHRGSPSVVRVTAQFASRAVTMSFAEYGLRTNDHHGHPPKFAAVGTRD